jgi:hypothetical protein
MRSVLLVYIALGTAGLILGAGDHVLAEASRSAHERPASLPLGDARRVLTAALLALLADWQRIWWLLAPRGRVLCLALVGYVSAKRRWRGWLAHLAGQGGSCIAMRTALLVVNWETLTGTRGVTSPLAWGLPTVVGSPIIE